MSDSVEPTTDDREKAWRKWIDENGRFQIGKQEAFHAGWDAAPAGKPVVSREALAAVILAAEREHSKKLYDWNVNALPNMRGWDEEAWKRDFPYPGSKEDYVLDALLASGLFESRESVQAEAPKNDTEPWLNVHNGDRSESHLPGYVYDPLRPNLDPLPYKHPDLPDGDEVAGLRYSYPIKFTSGVSKFLPRPEFSKDPADYGLEPAHDN